MPVRLDSWHLPKPFNNSWICSHQERSQITAEWPSRCFSRSYPRLPGADLFHLVVSSREESLVCYSTFSNPSSFCLILREPPSGSIPYSVWVSLNWVVSHQLQYSVTFPTENHCLCQHQELFSSRCFYFCLDLEKNKCCLTSIPTFAGGTFLAVFLHSRFPFYPSLVFCSSRLTKILFSSSLNSLFFWHLR